MATKRQRSSGHDFASIARNVVEQAIGERLDGSALPIDTRDPVAVERGKRGGEAGGPARANALSAERRRAIASKAAAARWKR